MTTEMKNLPPAKLYYSLCCMDAKTNNFPKGKRRKVT